MRSSLASAASVLCVLLAGSALAQPAPRAPDASARAALTLDALLTRLAASPGFEARFREEKRIALLAAPLVSEGEIRYAAPARFVRRTTSPAPAVMLLDGRDLRTGDGRTADRMDLDANPVVRQFVDGFMAVVRGDRAALERSYTLAFRLTDPARPTAWELTLTPRSDALRRVIRDLRLRGDDVSLASMTVHEASGDESETVFTQVNPSRRYSPVELARYFRLAP